MPKSEISAQEMSEPGVNVPVYDNPEKDKAVAQGWRRDTPPAGFEQLEIEAELPMESR